MKILLLAFTTLLSSTAPAPVLSVSIAGSSGELPSLHKNLRTLAANTNCSYNKDCDDGNKLTLDTCNTTSGKCFSFAGCNDGNACTIEAVVNGTCQYIDDCEVGEEDVCAPGLVICDDDNTTTMDICLPQAGANLSAGCHFIYTLGPANETSALIESLPNNTYFYEDGVSITEEEVGKFMEWIKVEVTQLRTPFCWRQAYERGVGVPLSTCPDGKEQRGLLCYTPCREGYSTQGTLDCQQECNAGWRDDGLFCRKVEYGRGFGYPWEFGDPLDDSGMFQRCERDHGFGACEKDGLVVYPKCRSGYWPVGCCICRGVFNCESEGYGLEFAGSCAVKIEIGDPTPLNCAPGEVEDAGLCYPPCQEGFVGVGPVCWQQCDAGVQVNCGAGCATDNDYCGLVVFEQVISPLIVAANIVTATGAGAIDNIADQIILFEKAITVTSKVYRVFLILGKGLAKLLQTIKPANLPKGASLFTRIKKSRFGNPIVKGLNNFKISRAVFASFALATQAFATDFVAMTSEEIARTIDTELDPVDALYVKMKWASIQFMELAAVNGWALAELALIGVGIADISGIVDLIAAYAKPKCAVNVPFPKIDANQNRAPTATCRNTTVSVSRYSNCTGVASAYDVGFESKDDDLSSDLTYFINGQKDQLPVTIFETPISVNLVVQDDFGLSGSCSAHVNVVDETPPTIVCPEVTPQVNNPSVCGAGVLFGAPNVTTSCLSTSTTRQLEGLASGAVFPVGTTSNTLEVEDSNGLVDSCNFKVTVSDVEKPKISCRGLATILPTNDFVCTRIYEYTPPVGTDNCGATTAQLQGPPFSNPYLFPVTTTKNVYGAFDPAGNNATCSFDVIIEDREKPTIECPAETIRPCFDTLPDKTGSAKTMDNCQNVSAPVLTYSDDVEDNITGTCPEITIRTWLSTDWKGNTNDCTQKIIEVEPDALTDATNCKYESPRFNTVFAPNVTSNKPAYKLSATTPGQFVYHMFHVGAPGDTVLLSLEIPYPFVTRGLKPVYAYDWVDLKPGAQGQPCFLPKGQRFFESSTKVILNHYRTRKCGDSKALVFGLTVPETGFIHLSIDLDLGLKGTSFDAKGPYAQWLSNGQGQGLKNTSAIEALAHTLPLQDRCMFEFSSGVRGVNIINTRSIENIHVFKRNQGVAGFIIGAFANPVMGVAVTLLNSKGARVGSSRTDADGYYNIAYKHTGPLASYTVRAAGQTKSVVLQTGKSVKVVDFRIL